MQNEQKERIKKAKEIEATLPEKQIRFCQLYISEHFGNGTQAYIEAFNIDIEKEPYKYNGARVNASKLLTNHNVLDYIRLIRPLSDLNELTVDEELAFVIKQNADFGSKVAAIREFNKLNNRIEQKLNIGLDKGIEEVKISIKSGNDKKRID